MITHLFGRVHFKTNYNYRLSNHCFINELILVTYALISNALEKSLIFSGGLVKVSQGKAAGNGQVWLSGVKCTGHENNILDCKNEGLGEPSQDCTSEKAVWVQCDGDTYENAYGRGIYSSLSFI